MPFNAGERTQGSQCREQGTPPPRGISIVDPGRSTGSRELDPSPSRASRAQWLHDGPTLAYRCGGSTGLAPVSRLTRRGKHARAPGIACARTLAYGQRVRAHRHIVASSQCKRAHRQPGFSAPGQALNGRRTPAFSAYDMRLKTLMALMPNNIQKRPLTVDLSRFLKL